MSTPAQQLFQAFRDQNGKVDLVQIYQLMTAQSDQLRKSSDLMMIKLNQKIQSSSSLKVDQAQLAKILDMNPTDEYNFNLIFRYMSTQDYITLNQLKNLNNKLKLGLTLQQMRTMMDSINPKSDKVTKTELLQFLSKK